MWLLLFLFITFARNVFSANSYHDCNKLFNPQNYMDHLPSLSIPYVNSLKIPYTPQIKATPTRTTKVINLVTEYVYKNPVCVRITGKKTLCQPKNSKNDLEHIITKEYFVTGRKQKEIQNENDFNDLSMYLEASEEPRPIFKPTKTPNLFSSEVQEMLIEDRLDQLESILPYYTRKRTFQTSTITVTKVRSNHRATATLLVKNCIPQGFDLCPPKIKKRKSKVSNFLNSTVEQYFYG